MCHTRTSILPVVVGAFGLIGKGSDKLSGQIPGRTCL